jgi:hypothetical protein
VKRVIRSEDNFKKMLKKPDFTTENVVSAIATILEEVRYLVWNFFHMFIIQSMLKAPLYIKMHCCEVSGITEVVPLEIMTLHYYSQIF